MLLDALSNEVLEGIFAQGVKVDLREPVYCEGVLTTTKGGVIVGPNLRIQAQNIKYTRKMAEGKPIFTIEAEEDLILEFGEYIFIGKRLEYDFQTKTGVVYEGRTGIEPWFFGGERIHLCADGSYIIYNGFVTTSENICNDWELATEQTHIWQDRYLEARHVKFKIASIPLLWIPRFEADLDAIFDNPIRYSFRWGGHQGPRFGLIYEIFSWNRLKVFLRFDYRFTRGPGGGIETHYRSEDHVETFDTINYVARDNSLDTPHEKMRYRFSGLYHNAWDDERSTLDISYDKISDMDMPTDYKDKGLELDVAGRTRFLAHHQEENWMANFLASVRVNSFQTLKQELPTFEASARPYHFERTGIISESEFTASYLDFKYANSLPNVHNYHSSRIEGYERFYRPFRFSYATLTPEVGGQIIYFGNSSHDDAKLLAIGTAGCELNTQLHKFYGSCKHVIQPYARYDYYTFPSVNPDDHYIFDINDGLYRLDQLKFGICQNFYHKSEAGCVSRFFKADVFTYAFFDTPTSPGTIPRIFTRLVWNVTPRLRQTLETGWNFFRDDLDHFNFRTEWTVSDNLALAAEYRHRDAYYWRKADKTNFMLDSFRSVRELLDSSLSDRRDTVSVHCFYRFHPNWAIEYESRHGWNRRSEPHYNEINLDIITTLTSSIDLTISYQHKENDRGNDRIAFYLSIGQKRPNKQVGIVPCAEF